MAPSGTDGARLARSTSSTSSVSSVASVASNASDDGHGGPSLLAPSTAIVVAVRVRPPNAKELATQLATDIVRTVDEHIVAFDPLDAFGRDVNYQPGVPTHRNRKAKVESTCTSPNAGCSQTVQC